MSNLPQSFSRTTFATMFDTSRSSSIQSNDGMQQTENQQNDGYKPLYCLQKAERHRVTMNDRNISFSALLPALRGTTCLNREHQRAYGYNIQAQKRRTREFKHTELKALAEPSNDAHKPITTTQTSAVLEDRELLLSRGLTSRAASRCDKNQSLDMTSDEQRDNDPTNPALNWNSLVIKKLDKQKLIQSNKIQLEFKRNTKINASPVKYIMKKKQSTNDDKSIDRLKKHGAKLPHLHERNYGLQNADDNLECTDTKRDSPSLSIMSKQYVNNCYLPTARCSHSKITEQKIAKGLNRIVAPLIICKDDCSLTQRVMNQGGKNNVCCLIGEVQQYVQEMQSTIVGSHDTVCNELQDTDGNAQEKLCYEKMQPSKSNKGKRRKRKYKWKNNCKQCTLNLNEKPI